MATRFSSPAHRRRGHYPLEEPEMGCEAVRDWAELPRDALLVVLHKLNQQEILVGAGQVCCPWRRAAREEPELWRRIDMRSSRRVDLRGMDLVRDAVRRSAGRCEAFSAEGAADDDVLFFIGETAPSLKSLRLISCYRAFDKNLKSTITRFALLEELELSLCVDVFPGTCEAAGKACPLLRRFRLSKDRFSAYASEDDREAMGITAMRGLRSLQLFANPLGNDGLTAILDACARLESLDIRHCFNVKMDDAIRAKCARIKTLRLPDDSMDDYDLRYGSPEMYSWSRGGNYDIDWEFSSR